MPRHASVWRVATLILCCITLAFSSDVHPYRSTRALYQELETYRCTASEQGVIRFYSEPIFDLVTAVDPGFNLTRIRLHTHAAGVYPSNSVLIVCGLQANDLIATELCIHLLESFCTTPHLLPPNSVITMVPMANPTGRSVALATLRNALVGESGSLYVNNTNATASSLFSSMAPFTKQVLAYRGCSECTGSGIEIDRDWPLHWASDLAGPQPLVSSPAPDAARTVPWSQRETRILYAITMIARPTLLIKVEAGGPVGLFVSYDGSASDPPSSKRAEYDQLVSQVAAISRTSFCHECAFGSGYLKRYAPRGGTMTDYAYDVLHVPRVVTLSIHINERAIVEQWPCVFRHSPMKAATVHHNMLSWGNVTVQLMSHLATLK